MCLVLFITRLVMVLAVRLRVSQCILLCCGKINVLKEIESSVLQFGNFKHCCTNVLEFIAKRYEMIQTTIQLIIHFKIACVHMIT